MYVMRCPLNYSPQGDINSNPNLNLKLNQTKTVTKFAKLCLQRGNRTLCLPLLTLQVCLIMSIFGHKHKMLSALSLKNVATTISTISYNKGSTCLLPCTF